MVKAAIRWSQGDWSKKARPLSPTGSVLRGLLSSMSVSLLFSKISYVKGTRSIVTSLGRGCRGDRAAIIAVV